jgi:hypothetical protein
VDLLKMDIEGAEYRVIQDYKKKLGYGVGIHAGFFSEINTLVLSVVYFLHNKIQFKLHSGNANFWLNEGWQDYFLPFCPEINNNLLHKYNHQYKISYKTNFTKHRRMYQKTNYEIIIGYTKIKSGVNYLTFDLWDQILNRKLEKIHYFIPKLRIDGDLQHACHQVLRFVWHFNLETNNRISKIKEPLNLPEKYIGFQIRRGDKIEESKPITIEKYISHTASESTKRNAFVLTDYYRVIEELKTNYPEWNFYTLCKETEKGYSHNEFYDSERNEIAEGVIKLLANIEILRRSQFFVGTFSANPSMFLGMIMDREKTSNLDVPWQFWFGKQVETIKKTQ